MNELQKPVLILSDAPASQFAIEQAFKDRGFAPISLNLSVSVSVSVSVSENDKLLDRAPLAILIKTENADFQIEQILTAIKTRYVGLSIPVLALMASTPPLAEHPFDSILIEPAHPAQIVLRTISLIRLADMEQEIGLRLHTLEQDFGITHDRSVVSESDPFNILFIGKASPEFMVVINALQRKNVRVVAAFTSFTAF